MSEEGFRQYLQPYIRNKIPFLAYWYPKGFGLIRLDEVTIPDVRREEIPTGSFPPTRRHVLSKSGRRAWERSMAQLRKHSWSRVITLEFDGERLNRITPEGGFTL